MALILTLGGVTLWKSGRWLVYQDSFARIPWAVVLAGESRDCERTDAVSRLYQDGRIDTVVLSGCRIFKTHYQSEYMLDYLVDRGVPRDKIFEFRQDAYSTIEEARLLIRQFRFQNLDTVLIVTSNYHSARTHRIFRKLAQGYPHVLVYPAEFHGYDPAAWWSSRESMKYWVNEWLKTFYTWFELYNAQTEIGKADYQNLLPDIWLGQGGDKSVVPASGQIDTSGLNHSPKNTQLDSVPPISSTIEGFKAKSDSGSAVSTKNGTDSTKGEVKEKSRTATVDSSATKVKSDTSTSKGDTVKTNGAKAKQEAKVEATSLAKDSTIKAATKDTIVRPVAKTPEKRPFPKAEPAQKKKQAKKKK